VIIRLFASLLLLSAILTERALGADIVIPARKHSARSKGVVSADPSYSQLAVCHGVQGMQQWQFDLGAAGRRYIHVYYASG